MRVTDASLRPIYTTMKHSFFPTFLFAGLAFIVLSAPNASQARFVQSSLIPADALLQKTDKLLKESPRDSSLHYLKGRIHYLAFYNKSESVPALPTKKPSVVAYWQTEEIGQSELDNAKSLSYEHALHHAKLADESFRTALELAPDDALTWLGLASLLEQVSEFQKAHPSYAAETFAEITPQSVREAYYNAWKFGLNQAQTMDRRPPMGLRGIVSYEAGQDFLRLAENTEEESTKAKNVRASLQDLEKLKRGPITPIIFSLDPQSSLQELLGAGRHAFFDLDGDGQKENWNWVAPNAYFLVWDPTSSGTISSGRQLFGNYTFQIPWINGYEALAMLDSDGSGSLSENELDGIRAWNDKDADGISTPDEIVDLAELGIAALGYDYEDTVEGPFSPKGLELADGSSLPSWDWISTTISVK